MSNYKFIALVPLSIAIMLACGHGEASNKEGTALNDHPVTEAKTADEVLSSLKSGNENFVKELLHPGQSKSYSYADQVAHTKTEQHPTAFILTCIDSRVPPEIIFDQGIGRLFVGRVAGNVEDTYLLGSMEYAVDAKHVKLIVVMGHTNCGAVHAAFGTVDPSDEDLVPLIDHVKHDIVPNDTPPYDASAKHNVKITIGEILKNSKLIRSKVDSHELTVVGALYNVADGTVDWDSSKW